MMPPPQTFLTHWYFHVPNLVMAAVTYMLIGRYILSVLFGSGSDNPVTGALKVITDPVLNAVALITPRIVPAGLLIVFSVVWLFAARLALFFAFVLMGMRPSFSG